MNIFYLDPNPKIAAQMMCDKHVIKMILESAQMLCTAHRVLDGDDYADKYSLYKMVHKNHPSTIWVRSGRLNYLWLYNHMRALMQEYTYRYGKIHASERLNMGLSGRPQNMDENAPFTDPPQCMPDQYKNEKSTVQAYQNYYHGEKARFAEWRLGQPDWWKGGELWIS